MLERGLDHDVYMKEAIEEAKKAALLGEVPVGACIVKGKDIISRAFNRRETDNDPTAHAELIAIREASRKLGSWRLEGCTMYVSLEPCAMCAGAILQARMDRVVFGALDGKAGACGSLYDIPRDFRMNHFVEVVSGVMKDEATGLLRDFFRPKR